MSNGKKDGKPAGPKAQPIKLDCFLKVPDIPGPSERDGHEDEIEVHALFFDMKAPHDPNSLSRRGRVALDTMRIVKHYDKSSPYLQRALYDATLFDEVVLSCRRTIAGETKDYLVVTLTNAAVSEYHLAQAAYDRDLVDEQIGFAFDAIKFNYDSDHEIEMSVRVGK